MVVEANVDVVEVSEMVRVDVWVIVVDGVGIERQEHAEDSTVAANRDNAGGIFCALRLRLATAGVGVVLSEVVVVTVVVVTLEVKTVVNVEAVSTSVPVAMVVVVLAEVVTATVAYTVLVAMVRNDEQNALAEL